MRPIDARLQKDCHLLGRLGTCAVLLHRDAGYGWFILVPDVAEPDFLELDAPRRLEILDACAHIGEYVKRGLGFEKLNFACIGNVVPQMHLHVVGRSQSDPLWPRVVWGNAEGNSAYSEAQVRKIAGDLKERCGLKPA